MPRIGSFLLGVTCGAALLHIAMNFHLVRAGDGFHLVGKRPARLSEMYIDIRQFSVSDWAGHPQLATDLVQANKQNLIGAAAANAVQDSLNQVAPGWPSR